MNGSNLEGESALARSIAQLLGRYMGQPEHVAMKLFVTPELKKIGTAPESLIATERDALLARLSMRIVSLDGKNRAAFLEEARKLR